MRRVVISIIALVVLGAGAWLVTRPTGTGGPARVLGIDPADVTELELTHADGRVERIVRAGDRWDVESGGWRWPAGETRVRAALQQLAQLTGEESRDRVGAEATTLTVRGGSDRVLRLSGDRLGGRGLMTIEGGGSYLVDGRLLDMFTESGLGPWRDERALPGAVASRVRLSAGERSVGLSRVQGRWGITAPFATRADEDRVRAMLRELGSVQVTMFEDGAGSDDAVFGFAEPSAVVVVESDRRETLAGEITRFVERATLTAGGPADVGGKSVFARLKIEEVRGGASRTVSEAVVRIPRDSLSGVAVDPAWYASRVALGVPAADVARIAVWEIDEPGEAPIEPDPLREANIALARSLDGWIVEVGRPPAGAPDPESYARGVIELLCAAQAESVSLVVPEGYAPEAFVQVYGAGGPPIGAAEIGAAGGKTVVRCGEMVYVYEDGAGGE